MKDPKKVLNELTLEEKCSLLSGDGFWNTVGIERLDVLSIMVTDGPHGLRKQSEGGDHLGIGESVKATCFPTAVTLASSWDRNLLKEVGQALGEESKAENVSVLLGPGINIKRSPLCGRNFEYFSEDPFLTGQLGANFVAGVQSEDVGTSLKHFAANNQEYHRLVIDTIVDERTLREIYLSGFETVVKESQPWTIMCSYNKINGEYSSDNQFLLNDVLRDEWGFEGIVVTDWGAMNDRLASIPAGCDLEMPGKSVENDNLILEAVKNEIISEAELDEIIFRLLELAKKSETNIQRSFKDDKEAHHLLAQRAAEQSLVLLKNENNSLPLKNDEKIAIIGKFAKQPRYQGAGSSQVLPTRLDNAFEAFAAKLGYSPLYAEGFSLRKDVVEQSLIEEAKTVAEQADTILLFLGLPDSFESEGFDRDHMQIPQNQQKLLDELAQLKKKIVVVLSNGSPVEMPWLDSVDALLEAYLAGQAGANAIVRIVYGDVNPSGKIAETFPLKSEDVIANANFPGNPQQVEYREALFVGYRYFSSAAKPVLFPFGYGLSYTSFEYRNLLVKDEGSFEYTVSCKIKNSGDRDGAEVVQLYIKKPETNIIRSAIELKGFEKIYLKAGEEKEVVLKLDKRSFAFWDTESDSWQVENGVYEIHLAASVSDLRLSSTVTINSGKDFKSKKEEILSPYFSMLKESSSISDASFETLLGRPIPEIVKHPKVSRNTTLGQVRHKLIGKILYNIIHSQISKHLKGNESFELMAERMVAEMPLRSLVLMTGGSVKGSLLDGLIALMNGKIFQGLKLLFK